LSKNKGDGPGPVETIDTELKLVRTLDRLLKKRHPDGVSLIRALEGGAVISLHKQIRQSFNPHACGNARELTEYLWHVGRTVTLEPGGGITIAGGGNGEKFILGRTFYREVEAEYRIIHGLIAEALTLNK